ncbi:MAG: DUF4363 family protein [Firmicutes bacterium]|nr:DUF4363 family protein [Bacillota bacterium]
MKDLLAATLAVVLLIGSWLAFFQYSESQLEGFNHKIQSDILPAIEEESWDQSIDLLKELNQDWHKYRKISLFFLNTDAINEIDYSLAKSIKYAQAEDVSNSTGELNAMIEQIKFLIGNDRVTLDNIF